MVTASSGHSSEKRKEKRIDRYKKELGGLGAEEETAVGSQGNIPKGRDKTLISLASSEKMRQSNHSNTSDFPFSSFLFFFFLSPIAADAVLEGALQILQLSIDVILILVDCWRLQI